MKVTVPFAALLLAVAFGYILGTESGRPKRDDLLPFAWAEAPVPTPSWESTTLNRELTGVAPAGPRRRPRAVCTNSCDGERRHPGDLG